MPQSQGTRFTADPLTFVVRHQLWDANVEDHSDQGVSIDVAADVDGKQTSLLRFNCFDLERSYVYGPENPEPDDRLAGSAAAWACTAGWTRSPTAIRSAGPSRSWAETPEDAGPRRLQGSRRGNRPRRGAARSARRRGLRQRNVHRQAEHGEAQPRHRHLRSRQHPVRPGDAAAAERRRRPRAARPRRRGRIERQGLRRRDGGAGVRLFLEQARITIMVRATRTTGPTGT